MMKTMGIVLVAALAAGCEGEPPSCQQAIAHFYGEGCAFFSTSGVETSQNGALEACLEISVDNAPGCDDELGDWLICLHNVERPPNAQSCDCSQDLMALITCN
jgi:hypothetical protein